MNPLRLGVLLPHVGQLPEQAVQGLHVANEQLERLVLARFLRKMASPSLIALLLPADQLFGLGGEAAHLFEGTIELALEIGGAEEQRAELLLLAVKDAAAHLAATHFDGFSLEPGQLTSVPFQGLQHTVHTALKVVPTWRNYLVL